MHEQLIYEFRGDLASNMNDIEKFYNKKNEQLARAITEIAKDLKV